MRIWSIHPCFLDQKRLVAQWREGLGIIKVLEVLNQDPHAKVGYKNHPQVLKIIELYRKSESPYSDSVKFVKHYLFEIASEAIYKRNYNFNLSLLGHTHYFTQAKNKFLISEEQLEYETFLMSYKNEEWVKQAQKHRATNFDVNPLIAVDYSKTGLAWWEKPKPEVLELLQKK